MLSAIATVFAAAVLAAEPAGDAVHAASDTKAIAPAASPTVLKPEAAPRSDAPRARFDAGRDALLHGDFDGAAETFAAVATDPGAGAALGEAARVLAETAREMGKSGRFALREPFSEKPPVARLDRRGRGELAWFTTFYGIWVADGLGAVAEIEDGKAYLVLTIAGAGAGLASALLGTQNAPMSQGRAATIESATVWASVNASVLSAIANADGREALAGTIGAGVLALGLSVPLTANRAPSPGDMSIVNSAGFWGVVAGALSLTFMGDDLSGDQVGWTLLAATDLGLLTGGLMARRVDVSRGRVLVIDAGGLLGGLIGIAVPVFAESKTPEAYGAAALGGIAAGLGVAKWLTTRWDEGEPDARTASRPRAAPALLPLADGRLAVGVAGGF